MSTNTSKLYDIPVKTIDGKDTSLNTYQGKVLLIVNVASKCGLTPQYEALEALYKKYQTQGLEVLGFPANNFMGQEPGSESEIKEFCQTKFNIDFPMFSKVSVVGVDQHPLYQQLIAEKPETQGNGDDSFAKKLTELGQAPKQPSDVAWNFEKFLVNREGEVVGRFAPNVKPDEAIITEAIEAELKKQPVSVG